MQEAYILPIVGSIPTRPTLINLLERPVMEDPSKWVEDSDWSTEKHYEERKVQGFSKADWINFDTYIAWVIASAVEKMKAEGHTMFRFPGEPGDTWEARTHEEYDVMIKGFSQWANHDTLDWLDMSREEYRRTSQRYEADLDAALEIFKKRFKSLWD